MDPQGWGIYGAFGVISIILGLIKEVLMIFLIFKGIQVANSYLNKNKDDLDK